MCNKASYLVLAQLVATVLGYYVDTDVGIYGGDRVKAIEDVPFMAFIWCNQYLKWCGGSVIHPQFILTAAHCVNIEKCEYTVQLNTTTIYAPPREFYDVENIFVHNKFHEVADGYDIALFKLSKATSIHNVIKVADQNTLLLDREMLDVYGWGQTKHLWFPKHLRHLSLPVINIDRCKMFYNLTIAPRVFCAGDVIKNKGVCDGDGGGPILKGSVQVGVVSSWGKSCGNLPGVFTKLSAHTTWIKETIEEYWTRPTTRNQL